MIVATAMNVAAIDAFEIAAIAVLGIALVAGIVWLALGAELLKARIAASPSHSDMRAIRDRVAELSGQMHALADRQSVSMDMIRSIQTHLLGTDQ